ncbi:hypothetical protein VNO77_18182 [Canavalia gladiata]|uniref:BHLH domain-containing protein n=1 Tax=Canavalia gladiata TaxID=3824 RepID=A0AAN9LK95_CANGL
MLDSTTHSGMTRSSSHMASINDNDFLELVWENGQVAVRGGSSNRTQKSPNSCIKYSISPSPKETIRDEDGGITKRTRLSTLYSLLDHFPSQRDSNMNSSHQSNAQDSTQSSQTKNSCKLNEEFANLLRPQKDSNNANSHHLFNYSSKHCLPLSPLKKQTTNSNQTTSPSTNSHNLRCDQREKRVNFSNFSIPAVFLKSASYQGNITTEPTRNARVDEIEASNKVEKVLEAVETGKGSDGLKGLEKQTPFVERSAAEALQDEHSEAVGHNSAALGIHTSHAQRCDQTLSSEALREKGNNANLCNEQLLPSSSVCSLGASNDPNFSTRKLEDTDDSTYLSDNDEEADDVEAEDVEAEDVVKQTPDREGSRLKRSRNAEVHNLSEKKRREKINKKMRTLKELIPNCNKVDKASMLDDAIDYLKTLKLQLQMMSMSSGLWPLMNMMLPGAAHHINGPHLSQLMGGGMGFRPPQFPIPPLSAITDNRLQMFGFNNQMPHMAMPPHAPFFPIIANSNSTQPHMATSIATTNLGEHVPNFATLQVSVPNNSDFHAEPENAAKQAPHNQVSLHHQNTGQLPIPFIFPLR